MKKKTKVIMAIAMAVVMLCSMALTVCAVLPSGKKYDYTYYPKKTRK